jgi:diguanylate cyclase (GGDEF)-like protein/PAS domain S-box-containing protein
MSVLRLIWPLCVAIYVAKLGTDAVFENIEIGSIAAKSALEGAVLVAIMLPLLAFFTRQAVRIKSEEKVADAAQELALHQYALDQAVIFATTDVKGRITWANDMFCKISGYTRQELIGQDHRILKSGAHSREFFREMYRQIASGKIWRGQVCNKAKNGSLYWVDTTIVPKLGRTNKPIGYVAIRIDISAQKATEQALRASEQDALRKSVQINAIIANMSQGLCMYDDKQRIVISNQQYAHMYGLSAEDVEPGTTLRQVVERRAATGLYSAGHAAEEFIDNRIAAVAAMAQQLDTLSDGRTILVSRQMMPDRGWITMHQDISDIQRHAARIAFLAHHDALTGLANRSYFKETIEKAAAGVADQSAPFSVFMLDLDGFKKVNDSLGHAAGDGLLKEVSHRLRDTLGKSDMLARLGGDEFAILQVGQRAGNSAHDASDAQHDAALALANRIVDVLNQPFDIDGSQAFVGSSIGISLAPCDGTTAEDLLKKADLALYEAKSNGRNTYRFFHRHMMVAANERLRLEADMRRGLERDEFELHYQPIIEVGTRRVTGAEALVRWRHPEEGLLAPDRFIPVAEETGLIIPLGEWVLYQACKDATGWPEHIKVAVNLSAVQFRKCDLLDVILCALADSGLAPDRLEIEVTETVLLERDTEYLVLLHQLKRIGVSIALDDFGTGYSSLSYLKQFPFDKIKIDRSFVADITDEAESVVIVSAVIGLSRSLNMITTVEGIETDGQFEIIREIGVTLAQGYLFGFPVPNDRLDFAPDRSASNESVIAGAGAAA